MSRKKNREHRRQVALLKQANSREEHIAGTIVQVQYQEVMHQFEGLPFDEKSGEAQLYLEVPHTLVRSISIKRVPA